MLVLQILLCVFVFFLLAYPIAVIIHELGHAIPAIILSREKVSIYIGSYGDPKKSIKLKIGLLHVWFKYNPFSWKLGLCVPSAKNMSLNKQIAYIICGPLASIFVALISCYFIFVYDAIALVKIGCIFFLASAIADFFLNIIPRNEPLKLYDGTITYNDGHQLLRLFWHKNFPKKYDKVISLFNANKASAANKLFDTFFAMGINTDELYRAAISLNATHSEYSKALELHQKLKDLSILNSHDYCQLGVVLGYLNCNKESMIAFQESLLLDPDNVYSLYNRGYLLALENNNIEAIIDFDRAIMLNPDLADSYASRGLSKINLGLIDDGLADIQYAIKIDPNNSSAYRNLGIYHLERGEKSEALSVLLKAQKINHRTHLINELIEKAVVA